MEYLANIHPGKVLQEEFLKPFEISADRLSERQEQKLKKDESESIKKLEKCC